MSGAERIAAPAERPGKQLMSGDASESGDGDKAARFKAQALPLLDDVYTLARYLMRNASDADDAVQECYLRAFRHFGTFRGGPIKPWLLAILRNVCHAAHGGGTRLVYTADDPADDAARAPMWREEIDTPEQTLLRRHASDTMQKLIEQLPAEFREVIVLREISDLSYREIAGVIDAPMGTVMSRLSRGRDMLREAWVAAEGKDEPK